MAQLMALIIASVMEAMTRVRAVGVLVMVVFRGMFRRALDAVAQYAGWLGRVRLHNVRALGLAIGSLQSVVVEIGDARDEASSWTCPTCCAALWAGLMSDYLLRPAKMLDELKRWHEDAINHTDDVETQRLNFEYDVEYGLDDLHSAFDLIADMLRTLQYCMEGDQARQNKVAESCAAAEPRKEHAVEAQRRANIQTMGDSDLQLLLERRLAESRAAG